MSDYDVLTTDFTDDEVVCLREIRAALDHCRSVFMHTACSVREVQVKAWQTGGTERDYAEKGDEAAYYERLHAGIERLLRSIDSKPESMAVRLRKKA